VQPGVEDAEGDQCCDGVAADDAGVRPFAEPLALDRSPDRELEGIDRCEHGTQREIRDDHRTHGSPDKRRPEPDQQEDNEGGEEKPAGPARERFALDPIVVPAILH
jgi:hypothetical protein